MGALITDGGEFHVCVPVPRMVLLEIWTQFFWGQEPTTTRRNKKVFFLSFSQSQSHIHFYKTYPSKLEQLQELCHWLWEPNCHSIPPALSNHLGTWIHQEGSLCSLQASASVKCTQVLLRYDTYIDSATLFSVTITKYFGSTCLENIPWCLIWKRNPVVLRHQKMPFCPEFYHMQQPALHSIDDDQGFQVPFKWKLSTIR